MAIMVCGIALTLSGHILEGNKNGILSYLISIANLMIFLGNEEFRLHKSMLFSSTGIAFMR